MGVRAVLLVPAEGDPHGLLREGPCRARPPMAWACDWCLKRSSHARACGLHWNAATAERCGCCDKRSAWSEQRALVLAWDGKPVAEGLDRARRIFAEYLGNGRWQCRVPLEMSDAMGVARNVCDPEHCNGGTLVLLDGDGREIPQ